MFQSKSAQNSIFLITEKVLTIGMAFVVSVLLARLGGTELFGEYAYITSFVGLFAPLCVMGLNNIVTKYVTKYPTNSHYYLKAALIVRLCGAVLSIALCLATMQFIGKAQQFSLEIILLVCCQGFNAFLVYEYFFLAREKVLPLLKYRIAVLSMTNALKVIVIWQSASLQILILLLAAEYVLIALSYAYLYRQGNYSSLIKRPINKRASVLLFQKGKWLLLSGIAAVIYMKIDQVMLASIKGAEEVAFYAAAAKLSEFWYAFPILIANAYMARLVASKKQGNTHYRQLITQLLSILILAAIVITALTLFLADWLVVSIYGDNFSASANILSIHIFASIFIFQRAIFSKWIILENVLPYSLFTHGIGAAINILLNLLLIPEYGGVGAAWATLISYAAASYVSLFLTQTMRQFALLMTKAMLTWPIQLIKNNNEKAR